MLLEIFINLALTLGIMGAIIGIVILLSGIGIILRMMFGK